jgi:DNA primase
MALANSNFNDFAQSLKLQADIVRVVGDYVSLKKAGTQNYSGLCPFHKEKSPSFSVHATRQFYHCFGCGQSGDVFSFVQKIENITFPEAIRAVAQRMGVALPKQTFSTEAEAKDARLRTVLLEIHERASAFFQECLRKPEGARAREYLAGRGLNEETIKQFRIGFAPDSGFVLRDRVKGEFSEEVMRESGLFSWKDSSQPSAVSRQEEPTALAVGRADKVQAAQANSRSLGSARDDKSVVSMYSKFRNRIMFPIANESGRVIAFTGRTLSTDEKAGPKYLNSPETAIYSKSRVLFNLNLAKEAIRALNYAILVEGQMDCISVFAAGFHNVLASSGTAFTAAQAGLLGRFSKQIVVNFDPDAAGAKATERTLGLLIEEEFDIKVLTLEPGFDPDLYVRRKGREAYAKQLKESSQPYFSYLIERARAQFPVRSGEGKKKAVNYLLPHVQRVPSRIVRDGLAEEIAQKLSIDSAVLRQELKHAAADRKSASVKTSAESQITDAEKILIRALTSGQQFQSEDTVSDRSGADDAFDPARQARYVLTAERLHVGLGTESLIEALLNASEGAELMDLPIADEERNLLAAILMKDDEELTAERIEGAVKGLTRVQIRRRLQEIQAQLNSLRSVDAAQVNALMDEKMRLKRALMSPGLGSDEITAASAD